MVEHKKKQGKSVQRVLTAIEAIQAGKMVIMTDDESRENEGDLVFAAVDACSEKINFMAKEARGLICLTLEPERIDKLQLPLMTDHSKSCTPLQTAFTVSIEAKTGVSTGISARDRARTIQVAVANDTSPEDLVVPGHVFPLRAKSGGVLERAGHTEGSVDLSRLAGKKPSAVICEIMSDDGTMARLPELEVFAKKFDLPLVSIEDLIAFRLLKETLIEEVCRRPFETAIGPVESVWFKNKVDSSLHFALIKGVDGKEKCVDVRVHKQRPLSDVFGTNLDSETASPSTDLIRYSLDLLRSKEHVCIIYLMQESWNEALMQVMNQSNPPSDPRLYGLGAQILKVLGIEKMRLHLSSERSLKGLAGFGLEITEMEMIK